MGCLSKAFKMWVTPTPRGGTGGQVGTYQPSFLYEFNTTSSLIPVDVPAILQVLLLPVIYLAMAVCSYGYRECMPNPDTQDR